MNKRQILASLNNIANTLDHSGFNREADTITKVMVKLAEEETESYGNEPAKKIIDDFVDQAKRNERYDPSILKMMNDRLEFNKHERMSEEKFRKMIGKNKEANSTRSMKKLAESENPDEDLQLERAIQTRVNQARKRFFASQPKSFFSKKDDVDSYRTLVLPLSEKLYNLIQGTDFSTDNTGWLRNKIEEILDENSDNFVFDKDNFLEVLKNYEHNLKWRENRNKFLKGQPFDAGLDEYGTI
jgi:hypothetical protein